MTPYVDPSVVAQLIWDGNKYITTENYTYDNLPDLATVFAIQQKGYGIRITTPTGSIIDILPTDNFVDIARSNNMPLNAADGGANYIYAKATLGVYQAGGSQEQAIATAKSALMAQGFTDAQATATIGGVLPAGTPLDSRGIANNVGVSYTPTIAQSSQVIQQASNQPVNSVMGFYTPPATQSSQVTQQASGAQTGNVTNTNQVASPASNQTVFGLFGDTSPELFGLPIHEYTALGIAAALIVMFMMGGRR